MITEIKGDLHLQKCQKLVTHSHLEDQCGKKKVEVDENVYVKQEESLEDLDKITL
jgi:hypothetical protein